MEDILHTVGANQNSTGTVAFNQKQSLNIVLNCRYMSESGHPRLAPNIWLPPTQIFILWLGFFNV